MKRILTRMSQAFRHDHNNDIADLVPAGGDNSQLRLCKGNEHMLSDNESESFLASGTAPTDQYFVKDILSTDITLHHVKEVAEHSSCLFDANKGSISSSDNTDSIKDHQMSERAAIHASSLSLQDSWSEGDPIAMADIDDWLAEQLDNSSSEERDDYSDSKEINELCLDIYNSSDSHYSNDITKNEMDITSQCSEGDVSSEHCCSQRSSSTESPINTVKPYQYPAMASRLYSKHANVADTREGCHCSGSITKTSLSASEQRLSGRLISDKRFGHKQTCTVAGGRTLFRSVSFPGNDFLSSITGNDGTSFHSYSSGYHSGNKQIVCLRNCPLAVSYPFDLNFKTCMIEEKDRASFNCLKSQTAEHCNYSRHKMDIKRESALPRLDDSDRLSVEQSGNIGTVTSTLSSSVTNGGLRKCKTLTSRTHSLAHIPRNTTYLERRAKSCIANISKGNTQDISKSPQAKRDLDKDEGVIVDSKAQPMHYGSSTGHLQVNIESFESNGGRLVKRRQGCAEVVQVVGKMTPLSLIPDLKTSAPESVDESSSELLSPSQCVCSDRSCSADIDSDEQQQQQQLRSVSDRLASSEDQAAQLLGDTQQLLYQLELLKDELQEEQEQRRSLQRLHQSLDQQYEQLQQFSKQLQTQLDSSQHQLNERQTLLKKHGLVMVGGATGEMARGEAAALISQTSASILQSAGNGSLESRIRRLASERNMLESRIAALKNDLDQARAENAQRASETLDQELIQRRAEKLKQEYSEKLKKSEQELNTLHATMLRLEMQAHRQRMHTQQIESNEDELRAEKRKLKKQLRESQSRIEELESCNSHLNKRMDKLNSVLKELTSPPPQQA